MDNTNSELPGETAPLEPVTAIEPSPVDTETAETITPPPSVVSAEPTPPQRRRRWVGPLLGGIVGAAVMALALWATGQIGSDPDMATEGGHNATAVATKVIPSIVTVDVGTTDNDGFDIFGTGSGVVLTPDGLIVTNHHVVAESDDYQVTFSDGRIYTAELVGSDHRTDLAVLSIGATDLVPIEIGSTESASIGQVAIAVGSPLGLDGGPSVTVGVVSAFGRQVVTGGSSIEVLFDMLQTDAPITEGSSGGALVDGSGRLLGITSAIGISSAGAEGIGFAIPVELMTRITDEIIETGSVQHPFIGVQLDTAFSKQADGAQTPAGAYVVEFVTDPSSAQDAGLEVGDLITAYNGNTVAIPDDLISGLRRYRAGDEVTLSITRDSQTLEIAVVLGVRPDDI